MSDSPRDVLIQSFPSLGGEILVSGGWGMSQEDACHIESDDLSPLDTEQKNSAWNTICLFVEKRIYLELIVVRPPESQYSGITWRILDRQTKTEDGRIFEWLALTVSAFTQKDWNLLKSEWEGPMGFMSDTFDIAAHNRHSADLVKMFVREYWFDVTNCYSRNLFEIQLPWVVAGFGRGKINNYEAQAMGQGYSVAYHGLFDLNPAQVTVYFYTLGNAEISEGTNDERIIETFHATIKEILLVNTNQFKRVCNLIQVKKFVLPGDESDFLYAEFNIIDDEGLSKSHLFFRGSDGRYLKIRLSCPANETFRELPFLFVQELTSLGLLLPGSK